MRKLKENNAKTMRKHPKKLLFSLQFNSFEALTKFKLPELDD